MFWIGHPALFGRPPKQDDGQPARQRLSRLVGLVYDLTVRPGLVLNKPPFRLSVVGAVARHNMNEYRPFARSGQCADDTLADDAPYLTLARFYGQQYRHIAGAERRPVGTSAKSCSSKNFVGSSHCGDALPWTS